jgi:hypothetical protein
VPPLAEFEVTIKLVPRSDVGDEISIKKSILPSISFDVEAVGATEH